MTKHRETLPKGYTCECGKFHRFPMYVYAHWRQSLKHPCDRCGIVTTLFAGEVVRLERPKVPKHTPVSQWTATKVGVGLVYRGHALRIRYDAELQCFVGYIGRSKAVESKRGSRAHLSDKASMAKTLQALVDQMYSGKVNATTTV